MKPFSWWQEQIGAGLPAFIDQLARHFNQIESDVLAFVPEPDRFDRLRRDAYLLQERYPHPDNRPPLFGIPIAVKDIFHVDGFPTYAGSKLPPEILAGEESQAVTRLKEAGGLILGKSVTTEFAYFGAGATRNPHNLEHTPGGSSSGSAAAVAAGQSPLAFGTQTIGSVNRPAAFCGVVGYKPSYDRIAKAGVIPLAPSLDHVGLFAPDVAGIQIAAPLLCGNWQPANLAKGFTLGIPEGMYLEHCDEEGLAHFRQLCAFLQKAGINISSIPAMPDFDQIIARHLLINAAETAQVHADWYTEYGDQYHPKTVELIERGKETAPDDLAAAKAGQLQLRAEIEALMATRQLDGWITPPAPGAAPAGLESTGNPVMNLPWSHCGLPSVTLPAGTNVAGLPLGVQLVGDWYDDEAILAHAAIVESMLSADKSV